MGVASALAPEYRTLSPSHSQPHHGIQRPEAGRKDENTKEKEKVGVRGRKREDEVEVGRKSRRDYPVPTGAYKRIMLGRAGAEMPACKRNQFAIRYDPGNSSLA